VRVEVSPIGEVSSTSFDSVASTEEEEEDDATFELLSGVLETALFDVETSRDAVSRIGE
jgi:hypothetical protein